MSKRERYVGQHLVRFHRERLLADIDAAKEKLGLSDLDLWNSIEGLPKAAAVATTFSALRRGVSHSMFGNNLRAIETHFMRPEGYYNNQRFSKTRNIGRKNGTSPKAQKHSVPVPADTPSPDGMQLTLDYIQSIRALPLREQAKAQRLLKFITEDLS